MDIQHTIDIAAPRECVWEVTTDFEHWPEWAPNFNSIRRLDAGPVVVGSRAAIKQPGLREAVWTVTDFTAGKSFTWETRLLGMRMIATHELVSQGYTTQNTLRLASTGLASTLFAWLLRPSLRSALVRENTGLKARCEAR